MAGLAQNTVAWWTTLGMRIENPHFLGKKGCGFAWVVGWNRVFDRKTRVKPSIMRATALRIGVFGRKMAVGM
ncbi:MAG: hypothetical protein ACYSYT_09320 [Planctomycetota bacterium]